MSEHKKSHEMPVTVELLHGVKDELKYDIVSNALKLDSFDSKIDSVNNSVKSVDKKIDSVNSRVDSVEAKVDALDKKIDSVNSRVDAVEAKVDALDKKVDAVNDRVDSLRFEMSSGFEEMKSMMQKVLSKVEEIDNRNKFVLDGHAGITARQDRHETEVNERLKNIEDAVFSKDH